MQPQDIVRAHVFVTGRVQGVGFRAFTFHRATHYGLAGWVRNMMDGRVELEAQGEKSVVDIFLLDMKQGPSMSQVEDVALEWMPSKQEYAGFEVKYDE